MSVDAQQPPWRVIRAFPREDGSSLVHLHNVSGGVLSGDRLSLEIEVGAGSAAQVTTTGATRLYRHRAGFEASEQHTEIRVGEGALLEYLPDAIIPFAGSRHRQRTSITLATGATFFGWETIAPGRQAMGEMFAFDRLRIETRIETKLESSVRPIALETFSLEPALRPPASLARMGAYTHTANFYACRAGTPAGIWRELEQKLNSFCSEHSRPGGTIWGATTLVADGISVRGLSVSGREIPATLTQCWKIARRFLTGQEAVPPRKVY